MHRCLTSLNTGLTVAGTDEDRGAGFRPLELGALPVLKSTQDFAIIQVCMVRPTDQKMITMEKMVLLMVPKIGGWGTTHCAGPQDRTLRSKSVQTEQGEQQESLCCGFFWKNLVR